jgi:hypothetical protein
MELLGAGLALSLEGVDLSWLGGVSGGGCLSCPRLRSEDEAMLGGLALLLAGGYNLMLARRDRVNTFL